MKTTDLRKICDAATPGEWDFSITRGPANHDGIKSHCGIYSQAVLAAEEEAGNEYADAENAAWVAGIWGDEETNRTDAAFIATFNPARVRALLDEIDALKARAEAAEALVKVLA